MKNFTLLLALLTSVAAAEDNGLYDPVPPAGSAFVRVVGSPAATLGGKSVSADRGMASAYVVIPQGEFDARVGAAGSKLKVEAGKFYSVVASGSKLTLLTDPNAENRAKALLTVYNLSKSTAVDLKTADGKTAVVAGVRGGESGSRAVNGVTADLAVFNGAKALGTLKGVKLERGNTYAIVVTDAGVTMTTGSTRAK